MMLAGKSNLITGAAHGIGRAVAERHVREGIRVVVAGTNEPAAQDAVRAIGDGSVALRMGVARQDSVDAAVGAIVSALGRLDIPVNNAGMFDLAPIVGIARESYRRARAVNVEGLLFTPQAAAAHDRARAGRRDHQLRLPSRAPRGGAGGRVPLVQGGRDRPHPERRARPRQCAASTPTPENLPPGEKKRRIGAAVPIGRMARPPDAISSLAAFLAGADGFVRACRRG